MPMISAHDREDRRGGAGRQVTSPSRSKRPREADRGRDQRPVVPVLVPGGRLAEDDGVDDDDAEAHGGERAEAAIPQGRDARDPSPTRPRPEQLASQGIWNDTMSPTPTRVRLARARKNLSPSVAKSP